MYIITHVKKKHYDNWHKDMINGKKTLVSHYRTHIVIMVKKVCKTVCMSTKVTQLALPFPFKKGATDCLNGFSDGLL